MIPRRILIPLIPARLLPEAGRTLASRLRYDILMATASATIHILGTRRRARAWP